MNHFDGDVPDLEEFAEAFRNGVLGEQAGASKRMCFVVSAPLRAALRVFRGVETELVTEDGHTFLVTVDGRFRIDPTADQFEGIEQKVVVAAADRSYSTNHVISEIPFLELMENFKRLSEADGWTVGPYDVGQFVAEYIYFPLAQNGAFAL